MQTMIQSDVGLKRSPAAMMGSLPKGPSIVFGLSPNRIEMTPLIRSPIANVAMTSVNSGALTIGRISTRSMNDRRRARR